MGVAQTVASTVKVIVICLDILSHKLNLDKRKIKCSKCNEEIDYIHDCEEPLLRDACKGAELFDISMRCLIAGIADNVQRLRAGHAAIAYLERQVIE